MCDIFIKTFGCSLNAADSQTMAGVLQAAGHKVITDESSAEVVIINSCIVKGHSQAQLFTYLKNQVAAGKKVVVAGCGAQGLPDKLEGYPLVGPHQLARIAEAVDAAIHGTPFKAIEKGPASTTLLPHTRLRDSIDIIPINKGCLGSCSFCIVKQTRGSLESFDPRSIIESIKSAIAEGVTEIWLTSPDTAVYGVDIKYPLPTLLKRVCEIEGDFLVRLGMGNPNWFIKYLDELPQIFMHPKMFRFLHVPVQSGSDKVLKDMSRGYTAKDYLKIVQTMRSAIPDISISTDIIVGFPGETEEDFQSTIDILKASKPDFLNLSRFTARPGTRAEKMPNQIPGSIRKDRSREIAAIQKIISKERNDAWLGWKGRIIIDEEGTHGTMIGRNQSYKPVVIQGKHKIGSFINVEVTESHSRFLKARLLSSH